MSDSSAHDVEAGDGGNAKIVVAIIGAVATIGGLITAIVMSSGGGA